MIVFSAATVRLPRSAVVGLLLLGLVIGRAPDAAAERPHVYAITGATVIVAPGERLESATIVVRDGLIEAVGSDVAVPADAESIDAAGMTVWAGFIDAYSHLGMQQPQGGGQGGGFNFAALFQQQRPEPGTGHPIALVHPQHKVTNELVAGDAEIGKRRDLGFGAALVAPRDGIFRGSSALVALGDGAPRDLVVVPVVAQHIGFDRGSFLGGYPSDLLGTMATIRQVSHDAMWYAEWLRRWEANPEGMQRPDYNDAFDALLPATSGPVRFIVEAGDNRAIERAVMLAGELGTQPIVVGGGYEYEMIDVLRAAGLDLIVPVNYADEPDVEDLDRLPSVSLQSLQRWEHGAGNAAALRQAGIRFAFTPYGMSNVAKFADNVRKAIEAGLDADAALAAVTTSPAAMLGVERILGTVQSGKIANLVVGTGEPFAEGTEIRHVFVDGHHWKIAEKEAVGDPDAVVDPRGEWAVVGTVMGNTQNSTWTIEGEEGDYRGRSNSDRGEIEFESVTLEGNALTVVIPQPGGMGTLEVTVVIEGEELEGSASVPLPNGQTITISFKGERTAGPQGGVR